jgi:hypothetical protein
MRTFVLTWNPTLWNIPDDEYGRYVTDTAIGNKVHLRWSVGRRRRGVSKGDRVFLLRQTRDRGIVASGNSLGQVFTDHHWSGSDKQATYIEIAWDRWLPLDKRLQPSWLKVWVNEVAWDHILAGGIRVPSRAAGSLEETWTNYVGGLAH